MKTSRFSDGQIIAILKPAEGGSPAPERCRKHAISSIPFSQWHSKYGVMDASLMTRLTHNQRSWGYASGICAMCRLTNGNHERA